MNLEQAPQPLSSATSGPALVTGAGSGIGRAIALRLARASTPLALVDRNAETLAVTAHDAERAGATCVVQIVADVANPGDIERAFSQATEQLGTLHAVVSAAGILSPGTLAETSEDSWLRHLAINAGGVFHCLKNAAARLADGASVVVVSSNAARVPRTGMAAYAASKAAASALTRCAGLELAGRGIRCNVIEPGSTDTPMQRDLWPDPQAGQNAAIHGDPAAYRIGIPLKRIADPDDVARVAAFLLSPDARHVTLQQIFVDGGASL